jgi:hypothetical protein
MTKYRHADFSCFIWSFFKAAGKGEDILLAMVTPQQLQGAAYIDVSISM